ncbi:hypothetical protein [Pseudoalteromonas sp. MMG005]|uniref:hypothetical protein n=1 Tax=Pseudoalteromonas sp. MMG005 TaxID=2822682 RepID=UPI001B3A56AC|nr:hypothetical protein [Pseudoalteromonas sp. MMG005]MBQ4846195.1 hypothetical protein [Pseudoalteromonas sp. MMG005]
MKLDLESITIFIAICSLYHLAVTWFALYQREKLASKVDDYLGSSDVPKKIKQQVFVMFDLAMVPFVFTRIFIKALKGLFAPSYLDEFETVAANRVNVSIDKMSEGQKERFFKIILSCISLYFKRSPISSFLVGFIIFIVVTIALTCDKLASTNYLQILFIKSSQGIFASKHTLAYT